MTRTINVPLTVEQIRLLADVTQIAANDYAENARQTNSRRAQDAYKLHSQRLSELAEIFQKISS